ncbi:unnamed protein product [Ceratitis capitata]|uniref:(Mediterranean fruit fly) hypothetical protein n=1 Tax=Ceratitis capitata TaxID=7213 RepID=A0A811VCL9_CERCA|nr:unnamed protein product [Ceratitis capitata]
MLPQASNGQHAVRFDLVPSAELLLLTVLLNDSSTTLSQLDARPLFFRYFPASPVYSFQSFYLCVKQVQNVLLLLIDTASEDDDLYSHAYSRQRFCEPIGQPLGEAGQLLMSFLSQSVTRTELIGCYGARRNITSAVFERSLFHIELPQERNSNECYSLLSLSTIVTWTSLLLPHSLPNSGVVSYESRSFSQSHAADFFRNCLLAEA